MKSIYKYICRQCKGSEVWQRVSTLRLINAPKGKDILTDHWEDYYFCDDCDMETKIDYCQVEEA